MKPKTIIQIDDEFLAKPRAEQVRLMTEAVRKVNPEAFDAAAATVRQNMKPLRAPLLRKLN